jgi:uncharacterized membrane protein
MEEILLLILLAGGLLISPVVISIIALVKVSSLRRELDGLRRRLPGPAVAPPPEARPVPSAAPVPEPVPVSRTVPPPPASRPVIAAVQPKKDRPGQGMEFLLGGKAAAFAGAAILVMGIAFLVGYAIQHSWIGPGTRVVFGLLAGGALVGTGYGLECRGGGKYGLLARVLTGAGSALFYFVVFAAYGMYRLIGAPACGAGLFMSALAVFGLSMVYNSQAVGVLGVLGAFITPLLIGGEMGKGVFPMIYVAVINAPVLLLGVRRKWQMLYNLAFVLTVFYFWAWLDWIGSGEYAAGLLFAVVYFMEFAALGLLKLRSEQNVGGRRIDLARLLISSLLLLWATAWILDKAGWDRQAGLAYLLAALLHMGLAGFARRLLSRFTEDILAFLGGGLLFAVLALPAQLDGEWVSLGWALEGAVLAWFAVRVQSRTLLGAAALIGLIGILKALSYDVFLYTAVPHPLLNVRFGTGLASCGLLGVQGQLASRFPAGGKMPGQWRDVLWWGGILAALITLAADLFWTMGITDEWAWLLLSLALLAVGAVIVLMVRPESSVRTLGALLLGFLPVQMVWFYLLMEGTRSSLWIPFCSPVPWLLLAALGAVVFWLQPRMMQTGPAGPFAWKTYGLVLAIVSLACALLILTLEIARIRSEWAGPLITILWAGWALGLILYGLVRRAAPYRVFGLVLFGLTTLKVLLVDSSELKGIERIAAFMGAGVLLLVLSFVYQKVSARFLSPGEDR